MEQNNTTKPSWQRPAIWAAVLVSLITNVMLLSQRNESRAIQAQLENKVDSISRENTQLLNDINELKAAQADTANP